MLPGADRLCGVEILLLPTGTDTSLTLGLNIAALKMAALIGPNLPRPDIPKQWPHMHMGEIRPMSSAAAREELPPGWKRVESRTKPGTYYYAHPATNRTQVSPPQGAKQVPAAASNGGQKQVPTKEMAQEESAPKASDEKEERKRKHQQVEEEAEAEQEMVEEELKRIKAAKKAKELEQKRKKEEERRLEQLRKEEEARLEKERLQREEEERKRQQELEALAEERRRREAEARKKDLEAQRRKAMVFEQHSILQRKLAEDARKRQAEEEERRKKEAEEKQRMQKEDQKDDQKKVEEPPKEEDEETRKEKIAKREAKVWSQPIPDTADPVLEPCFDVYKNGKLVRTHHLTGEKTSWIIGRGPAGVDIAIGNSRISRKHAEISCQTPLMFLTDLGSTYGSAMNAENLEKNQPVELVDGARFRFGGLPELYVYREPPPADEEVEEPSSPPIHAEVSGMATAEDGPDLPPQVPQAESVPAPVIDPEAAAAASAAARAAAEAEDEARVRRIQQKRQERKAAQEAEKAVAAAKKEEDKKKKQERIQKKRAVKEAKAAKKAARAAAAKSAAAAGSSILNLGDATPPDATLPDAAMASPPDHSPVASPKTDEAADKSPDDEPAQEGSEKPVDCSFF
ncbi:Reticulocyte-binding protein 2-like a [Symbiodinium microadriaticum]|uniref:Reticulocyte-binding protein 2-like a n=1 Tax=Symbiodinium microadriaticum TaxID=2951 RepID=A0A1Q9EK42_SYMMI|nr:Reticulocyte-binding protein 2-like a [Symbiodinium microadriaticum]CAE7856661.1 unnamed protein product [Symbiodinium microadriaticum]CAE7947442.1 unnamed protein product [Symbiodinium sp. KB8]